MAKVIPAWLGAISAWLLKCPDELQALNPSDNDTKLKIESFTKSLQSLYIIFSHLQSNYNHFTLYLVIYKVQFTLIVSNLVDSNFRLSRIFIEVPNFVVYKYI